MAKSVSHVIKFKREYVDKAENWRYSSTCISAGEKGLIEVERLC